jgi:hypothetical protein
MRMKETTLPKFSFFKGPITNKRPKSSATIVDIYRGLTSNYYKTRTEQYRRTKDKEAKKKLDFVTFAGLFLIRNNENLFRYSGYVCIDFDHIEPAHIEVIKAILLNDEILETQLLFVSPSGTGLKWVVEVDLKTYPDYEVNFKGIVAYLRTNYPDYFNMGNNIIDETGKDVSRACFLCYDPRAYINPKYLNNGFPKI